MAQLSAQPFGPTVRPNRRDPNFFDLSQAPFLRLFWSLQEPQPPFWVHFSVSFLRNSQAKRPFWPQKNFGRTGWAPVWAPGWAQDFRPPEKSHFLGNSQAKRSFWPQKILGAQDGRTPPKPYKILGRQDGRWFGRQDGRRMGGGLGGGLGAGLKKSGGGLGAGLVVLKPQILPSTSTSSEPSLIKLSCSPKAKPTMLEHLKGTPRSNDLTF